MGERQHDVVAILRLLLVEARVLDEVGERGELLRPERNERAVLQPVVAALLPVVREDRHDLIDGEVRAAERDLEQVVVVNRDARRDLRQVLHGLLLEGIGVEDLRLLRELRQRLREEVIRPLLIRLDEDLPLLPEAVGGEDAEERLLLAVVAHKDAPVLPRRGTRVDERVEGAALVGKNGAHLDAVLVVVEIELRAKRRELELLLELLVDIDVGDLFHGGQDLAEERLDVPGRQAEASRLCERLEERAHRLRVGRIHGVDRAGRVEVARVVIEDGEPAVLQRELRALAPAVGDGNRERRPLAAHARLLRLLFVEMQLERLLPHNGEELLEEPLRELAFLLIEQVARHLRAIVGKRTAVGEHVPLLVPRPRDHLPEPLRRLIGKAQGARGERELLAELEVGALRDRLEERAEVAHDVEAVGADAELEPFRDAPVLLREEEARHEVHVRLLLRRARRPRPPRAEELEEPPGRRARRHLPAAPLRVLDRLERRDDVLAGTEVELRGRALADVVLDTLPLAREVDIDLVALRAIDGGVVPVSLSVRNLRDASLPVVAQAPLVRGVIGERTDGKIFEHDAASQAMCKRKRRPAPPQRGSQDRRFPKSRRYAKVKWNLSLYSIIKGRPPA